MGLLSAIAGPAIGGVLGTVGSLIEGSKNRKFQKQQFGREVDFAREQADIQKEFAQKAVQWKTDDARKAGIHPLAAMGANTMSFTPQSVGSPSMSGTEYGFEKMGQNLGRVINKAMNSHEREFNRLKLDNMRKRNELLDAEINSKNAVTNQIQSDPPMANVQKSPSQQTMAAVGAPNQEAGIKNSQAFIDVGNGSLMPVPAKDPKELTEDNLIPQTLHSASIYGGAYAGSGKPSKSFLKAINKRYKKKYKDFEWNPIKFQWDPVTHKARGYWKRFKDWSNKMTPKYPVGFSPAEQRRGRP